MLSKHWNKKSHLNQKDSGANKTKEWGGDKEMRKKQASNKIKETERRKTE
jgi:hypothetical protein